MAGNDVWPAKAGVGSENVDTREGPCAPVVMGSGDSVYLGNDAVDGDD